MTGGDYVDLKQLLGRGTPAGSLFVGEPIASMGSPVDAGIRVLLPHWIEHIEQDLLGRPRDYFLHPPSEAIVDYSLPARECRQSTELAK